MADRSTLGALPFASSQTILVVDDVSVVRLTTGRALSEAGYRVIEASSAAEALELLSTTRRPIDLVLTDIVMPDMSGVDLVRMVRARWPSMRVVIASAHTPAVLVRERLQGPTIHFLAKPFSRQELLGQVRATLSALPATNDQPGQT